MSSIFLTAPRHLAAALWVGVACTIPLLGCSKQPAVAVPETGTSPTASQSENARFTDVAKAVGVQFHLFPGSTGGWYFPETVGAGVAIFDFDNDGDLDLFFVQGGLLNPKKSLKDSKVPLPSNWKPGHRLYKNLLSESGLLAYEDVTSKSGIAHPEYGIGVAVGDYDNDGFADLYLTCYGPNALYHNNGNGTFTNVTAQAGVDDPRWSSSAAFVDYDYDGRLDLICINYVDHTVAGDKPCYIGGGIRDYCGPNAYHGLPSRLFHNEGGGKFKDVSLDSGIGSKASTGLGVSCADFNGDGKVDIFVANDGQKNHLWINQGGGKFTDEALVSGAALDANGAAHANMGLAVGNFDNGTAEHILVTHYIREGVSVYVNDGQGMFTDAVSSLSLLAATLPFTGFGTEWIDYDNDGWLDCFIANGAVATMEKQIGQPWPFLQTNQLLKNENGGKTFRDISSQAGPDLAKLGVFRGLAVGDLDNDGLVDLVVTNSNGLAQVLRNETKSPGHWLSVKLEGTKVNRMALGAYVTVNRAGLSPLRRRCHTDGSYCSASDARVHFGLAENPAIESILVEWPGGQKERYNGVQADQVIKLKQGTGEAQK